VGPPLLLLLLELELEELDEPELLPPPMEWDPPLPPPQAASASAAQATKRADDIFMAGWSMGGTLGFLTRMGAS
jgi:hypothetical protein